MGSLEPSIREFRTDGDGRYVFDDVTGLVIPVDDVTLRVMRDFKKAGVDEIARSIGRELGTEASVVEARHREVARLVDAGCFFRQQRPASKSGFRASEHIATSPGSTLTLITTEACNLRCTYCIYSDRYPGLKSYGNKVMPFEVARKAIDLYMDMHAERREHGLVKRPALAFYGGEPLIESDLMFRCIDYCHEHGHDPRIYVTTNGTLMSDEVLAKLIEYKVLLTFSLDGPKEEHDRKRVYRNQRGTFDDVMSNVVRLQERKAEAGITIPLSFNCCYDTYTDLEAVVGFFEEHESVFEPCSIMWAPIQAHNSDYYEWLDQEAAAGRLSGSPGTLAESYRALRDRFKSLCVADGPVPNTLVSLMSVVPLTAHRYEGAQPPLKNACAPGSKLAVDADGNIYACEKVNQQFAIGHVDTGIDTRAVDELFRSFLEIWDERCSDCAVSRLCGICVAFLANEGRLQFSETYCEANREGHVGVLECLYSILEKRPDAFADPTRFARQYDGAEWEDVEV